MGNKFVYGAAAIVVLAFVFSLGQKVGFNRGQQASISRAAGTQPTKSRNALRSLGSLVGGASRDSHYSGKRLVRNFFEGRSDVDREALTDIATQALKIRNAMDRKAAIRELMGYVSDVEQVLALQEVFSEVTRTTGRDHHGVWQEFLFLSGEKFGVELVDSFAQVEEPFAGLMWNSFRGWSSREPENALQWINDNREVGGSRWQKDYLGMVMGSAVLSDPWNGEALMKELSEQEQVSCMEKFCSGLIQAEGVEGALGYYQRLEQESGETESKVAAAARFRIHSRIKQASHGKEGVSVFVEQLDELHAIRPFTVANFGAMSQQWKGESGLSNRLDFLEQVESRFGFQGEELHQVIAKSRVLEMEQVEFERFEQWVQENPSSVILDDLEIVREVYENSFLTDGERH